MLDSRYDVVVIGAGPIGIYTSLKLAKAGFRVMVIEEDAQIGRPRFCTGLISKEAFDEFFLPREAIENEFHSARVFSPLGSRVYLNKETIQVYVTDRTIFDYGLYLQAEKIGVEFLLKCRCLELKIDNSYVLARVSIEGKEAQVRSDVAVLATGIKYNLHRCAGLLPPPNFLNCSQVQVCGYPGSEIEIFLGSNIAPHSFAWIVPLKEKELRIGLSTHKNSNVFLKSFLKHLKLKGRIDKDNVDIIRRPVPLGAIKKTYTNRLLAVGDAAGQVKPITGGGIYFGLLCADLAAETISCGFKKRDFSGDFFSRYEINWKKKIEFDLTMGLYLRKLIAHFNDNQIEELIRFCSQDYIQNLIRKYADFNHHGKFIRELIKMPAFWKALYKMLSIK